MNPVFVYPSSALDEPDEIKDTLGSFWASLYGDQDFVDAYCLGKAQIELQTLNDLNEAANGASRRACPVYHRVRWYPYKILRSQALPGNLLDSGEPADDTVGYLLPTGLVRAPVLCDAVTNPTVVWTARIDYFVDTSSGKLILLTDPFTISSVVTQPVYDTAGAEVDREVTLWLFQADFDHSFLYRQFGYVLAMPGTSGESYKAILNATTDALVSGTTRRDVEALLSAITGSPLAEEDGEVVKVVTYDAAGLLVITDQHVYRYSAAAQPVVVVGQVLRAGEPLSDAFAVYGFNSGATPPVSSLSLGSGFLDPSIVGALSFVNADVPTVVTTAWDGHTVITFEVGGNPTDVANFWDLVDARGSTAGNTLANLLDERTNKVGEPSASNLPTTINPLAFVSRYVLRYHALLVVLKSSSFGPDALGLGQANALLRKIIPPHQALLMLTS